MGIGAIDVNDTVRRLVALVAELRTAFNEGKFPEHEVFEDGASEIGDLFAALDTWLMMGGAFPDRWLRYHGKDEQGKWEKLRQRVSAEAAECLEKQREVDISPMSETSYEYDDYEAMIKAYDTVGEIMGELDK